MFSRNTASSRAIPTAKILEAVRERPYVPEVWYRNRPGMTGVEELTGPDAIGARSLWLLARDEALRKATLMLALGVHKQHVNRLLEPWMWVTSVTSSTEWSNFFHQRCHPDAQPEFRRIADMVKAAIENSTPRLRNVGEWHLPFTAALERPDRRVTVGRAAGISFLRTTAGVEDAIRVHDKMLAASPRHLSPFEHAATPGEGRGNFRGWVQYREEVERG